MAHRRHFLIGVATASTVGIAGCSQTELEDIEGKSNNESEEDENEDSGEQIGPEAAVEQYRTGLLDGKVGIINEVIYEDSTLRIEDSLEPFEGEVKSYDINEVSLKEWASQKGRDSLTEEQATRFREDSLSKTGGDEFALVRWKGEFVTKEGDEESFDQYFIVHKIDGEWLIKTSMRAAVGS